MRTIRRFRPASVVLLALLLCGAAPDRADNRDYDADWKAVEDLIADQRFEAAHAHVREIRDAAAADGHDFAWTRALIEETCLRTALHGYETAVKELRASDWPEDPVYRAVLELYFARALTTYHDRYDHMIRQRERIIEDDEVDLEQWTSEQIIAAAHAALGRAWAGRAAWGDRSLGELGVFIQQNDYPARIRGTLRDAVTYMWAELLVNTRYWTPAESNEKHKLDAGALIRGEVDTSLDPADPKRHPLERLCVLLEDLERWHAEAGRYEAAHEARLTRLWHLFEPLSEKRDAIVEHVVEVQGHFDRGFPWWSQGQWFLCQLLRRDSAPDALRLAHDAAVAGRDRHPESIGGLRCAHALADLERPHYDIDALSADAAERRTIHIVHKNLDRLYFRAWRFDLEARVDEFRTIQDIRPDREEVERWLETRDPDLRWTVDLPETPDFRDHQTYTGLPDCRKGAYMVLASTRQDFARELNRLGSTCVIVTDLVLTARELGGELEVIARSGETGRPLAGVDVSLLGRRGKEAAMFGGARSGADGRARIIYPEGRRSGLLFGRRGKDLALIENAFVNRRADSPDRSDTFIYTDRSIYRPGQTIHWKAIPFDGNEAATRHTLPDVEIIISLVDTNHEEVAADTLVTNAFGSASGSFEIPRGRLLGHWYLNSSLRGRAGVRVEEYKRPTFEVSVDDPAKALRLNRPAELIARADRYYGLPITEGEAVWRVERSTVYPRWWFWWWPRPSDQQTMASGRAELSADGSVAVSFTPEADETLADERDVYYAYTLHVDVTDAGGETRSTSRTFRLGFTSVAASIDAPEGFLRTGARDTIDVRRTDLDGVPRPGSGRWRLVALVPPEHTPLPGDLPLPTTRPPGAYLTEGDTLRSRVSVNILPEQILELWPEGRTIDEGGLDHDEGGLARIALTDLPAGAYRLRYETEDAFGATAHDHRDLIVAGTSNPRLNLPLILRAESETVAVGDTARILIHSGYPRQDVALFIEQNGERIERRAHVCGHHDALIEIPIDPDLRGGFTVSATSVRDHQVMKETVQIRVPWDDKRLAVEFATFRDRMRPGARERFRVTVRDHTGATDPDLVAANAAELVAYMYDRSLDLFGSHYPPQPIRLFPLRLRAARSFHSQSTARYDRWHGQALGERPPFPRLIPDRLTALDGNGIGGMGLRIDPGAMRICAWSGDSLTDPVTGEMIEVLPTVSVEGAAYMVEVKSAVAEGHPRAQAYALNSARDGEDVDIADTLVKAGEMMDFSGAYGRGGRPDDVMMTIDGTPAPVTPRTDFSETAFFLPHLTLDEDGAATIEFEVPESLTDWNVWVHALTRDLRSGSAHRTAATVKDLMVRPYLPRFLREGDRAVLKVVVDNAGETDLSGRLELEIFDPETEEDLRAAFGLDLDDARGVRFSAKAGASTDLSFPVSTPARVGEVAVRVTARAGDLSDGEQRALPVLPGRTHLIQSRFASLREDEHRTLRFDELAADDDPTRIDERLAVTVDAQLFYGALNALPYLIDYPYHCSEQLLNKFVSTGIVTSLFDAHPEVAEMARTMSERDTELVPWDADDPNRTMLLEETPWLRTARGGRSEDLIKVLDPDIARETRDIALRELLERQDASGGFPWMPGGEPSPWITLYLLHGFAKGLEFGVDAPRDAIIKAWRFMRAHEYERHIDELIEWGCCWQTITFLNYVLSCYPDESWTGGVFTEDDRARMLDFSWSHWREHSPLLKGYLALTLARAGRQADAERVFAVIMDSAKEDPELGVYWAPEDYAWLWYNDTVETHAFALRVMTELRPDDPRRHGLVQWLLLNRHLNHWKSTRATAEAIYSLIHYLEAENAFGKRETVTVTAGPVAQEFVFEPGAYTGADNRIVVEGAEVEPSMAEVDVAKTGPGTAFVSATWHFSTERPPKAASGDFFSVERAFFLRRHDGEAWTLTPLAPGDPVAVGDQVEVQLTIRAKHAAEYVHLRDPRGAGFEPESVRSGYRWGRGSAPGHYEEIRDSGANYFFSRLPVGECVLKHRVRATTAGAFMVQPAVLQSMYAPEFGAYSAGERLRVE